MIFLLLKTIDQNEAHGKVALNKKSVKVERKQYMLTGKGSFESEIQTINKN